MPDVNIAINENVVNASLNKHTFSYCFIVLFFKHQLKLPFQRVKCIILEVVNVVVCCLLLFLFLLMWVCFLYFFCIYL